MPVGTHPQINSDGALIGILVQRQITPAIGEPTITTEGTDEDGNPITLTSPNPDYVPPRDATLDVMHEAVENAGVALRGDVFESGDAPNGQARIAFWIEVGDDAEVERRDLIGLALADFAPLG